MRDERKHDRVERAESATERAHGTHGQGDAREELRTDGPVYEGNEEQAPQRKMDDERTGGAGWGSESAGGSVTDKRAPEE